MSEKAKVVCNVCDGDGWISETEWESWRIHRAKTIKIRCPSCGGKGYVWAVQVSQK